MSPGQGLIEETPAVGTLARQGHEEFGPLEGAGIQGSPGKASGRFFQILGAGRDQPAPIFTQDPDQQIHLGQVPGSGSGAVQIRLHAPPPCAAIHSRTILRSSRGST